MKNYQIWQRLWERADVRCGRAFTDWQIAMNEDWPTDECLKVWNHYDRWYKVRDYIARRHRDAVLNHLTTK